jgi:hypothetical protein
MSRVWSAKSLGKSVLLPRLLGMLLVAGHANAVAAAPEPEVVATIDVAPVWAGHPVGFALLTATDRQYVAFYDADRHLTVAARSLADTRWEFFRLASAQPDPPRGPKQTSAVLGWDSHNNVVMAIDSVGHIHLAGNMHDNGLTYYRTHAPGAISTFEQVAAMTGRDEDRCTYPLFMTLADGRLVFRYRSGQSGNGDWIMNVYDTATQTWRRHVDTLLFDGQGKQSAYPLAPVQGPDGFFHVSWVWREAADCSMNHDLCYARTRDFIHWETAGGELLSLPLTLSTPGVTVDPVPVKGGILNGTGRVGFDSKQRPVISYPKYDADGNSQAHLARFEEGRWRIEPLTTWDHRHEFSGGGTLGRYEINLDAVRPAGPGELRLAFGHVKFGLGEWVIDENSLRVLRTDPAPPKVPRGFWKVESKFPGMRIITADDAIPSASPRQRFLLRWETLPANRDKPREKPWPEPSILRVLELRDLPAAP